MSACARGEAGPHLAWLAPGAASLVALARSAPAAWDAVRCDPGAVLLLVRLPAAARAGPERPAFSSLLQDPAVCDEALRCLDQGGCVDWTAPAVQPVYQAALGYARLAERLAERCRRCDPDWAWVAGLMAPLGWLAVCATNPERVAECLADPDLAKYPAAVQQRLWGFDQAALARRLARSWRLPRRLAAVAGHLGLPVQTAQALGADPDLFRVVQLAVALAQEQGVPLNLPAGATVAESAAALGLDAEALRREARSLAAARPAVAAWEPPASLPLLRDLLALAAENRRLRDVPALAELAGDVDALHGAVAAQHAAEAEQLQARKLSALAEFAAGAGHEINNPLAVISGQAQYLLRHEAEPARQQALHAVVAQAQRIHETLRELMQFARPPRPQMQSLDLHGLVCEVLTSLADLAAERRVRLTYPDPHPALHLHADPSQLRTALACLLRNAVEAAGADGWAAVRLEQVGPGQVDVVVEDSGQGPEGQQREHLFDPFYSGRPAGRGRGLGLPTAWRLVREHGGDVRFVGQPGGPTRFVLSLPQQAGVNGHP